jgi:beta-N-acetylhexosaminidase
VYESALLTNSFQEMARIPLLMASDFERGVGNQIDGATLFPPLMSLGAADSEELAYAMGKITAREGRAIGIHMTYAPVVDVNINPDNPIINVRSVGEDPELVSRIAEASMSLPKSGRGGRSSRHDSSPAYSSHRPDTRPSRYVILSDSDRPSERRDGI